MKKTLLFFAAFFIFVSASQAQFKQAGGERNLQLLFNPFNSVGGPVVSLNNGIVFRKFNATGTSAWRVAVTISSNNNTTITQQENDTLQFPDTLDFGSYRLATGMNPQAEQRISNFAFGIRPGYEKHFAGTDRLSPYVGAEVVFGMSFAKTETDMLTPGDYSVIFNNDPQVAAPTVNAKWQKNTVSSRSGSMTLGLNLVGGFDFYFAKNLSLGAELNFGYFHTFNSDLESEFVKPVTPPPVSVTDPNTFITTTTLTSSNVVTANPDQRQGGSSGFGPGVLGFIKLGWLF